jgi:hypothetical protein
MRIRSELAVNLPHGPATHDVIEQDALIDALLILLSRLRLPADTGAHPCSEALRLTLRKLRADADRDAAAVQSVALFTLRFLRIHQLPTAPLPD